MAQCSNFAVGDYGLSAKVLILSLNKRFTISMAYVPTSNHKEAIYVELLSHKPPSGVKWLVCRDFDQIYRVRDKNKPNFNRRGIKKIRGALS